MDRVYQSNAIEIPPSSVASSGSYPTAGNKASGQLATVPGAYWFYSVTEEIRNAIVASGITPSATDLNQLAQAISKYLPTTGGTVTGNVYFGSSISQTTDSAVFDITGGTAYDKGAYLSLSGKSSNRAGSFDLIANNGTKESILRGTPDGVLTWRGKDVVLVESWRSGTEWYRKYSDGFIEQGGTCTAKPSVTVTFPLAFSEVTLYVNINGYTGTANNPEQFKLDGKPSLTTFWAKGVYSTSNAQGTISSLTGYWYACGY